jgi:hypothetical protein
MNTTTTCTQWASRLTAIALTVGLSLSIHQGNAATIGIGNEITAITTSGATLTSFTYDSTVYNALSSPTSFVDNKSPSDWIHTSGAAPADITEAIGSLDVSDGSLNHAFEAQFDGLSDSALLFLLVNENNNTPNDAATVFPIDAAGNRLGGVSGTIDLNNDTFSTLIASQTYNRTTNGSANGTLSRIVAGIAFTLADLGIDGQAGTTGIEFETTTLDPQEIGIVNASAAGVPEPTSLMLVLGLAGLGLRPRRNRS